MAGTTLFLTSLLLCLGSLATANTPNCETTPSKISVTEGNKADMKVVCDIPISPATSVQVFCIAGTATPGKDTDSVTYTLELSGTTGSVPIKTVSDGDCESGDKTLTCFMGSVNGVHLSGRWEVTITDERCGCGPGLVTGPIATCEKPDGTGKDKCMKECPSGQTYSQTYKKCVATCPCKTGVASGDPHYTTFDGVRYDFQPEGSFIVAEDCQDRSWSICHVTSRKCAGGKFPTCADEVVINVRRLKTTLKYNRISNRFWFEGERPDGKDMAVTLSGRFFTAYLPKEGITIKQYNWQLSVSVCSPWFGRVCGLFGTPDNIRGNEFSLPDGSIVSYRDPKFINSFNCRPLPPPPPPPPLTCPAGPQRKKAEKFCKVLYSQKGAYKNCHSTIAPGNRYKEPVNFPYEQCVLDHCLLGAPSACSDILAYSEQCQSKGISVGNPPAVCTPECPAGTTFNKCGPLVPPSCDSPKGKKGCAVGCYCPTGQYMSRCGQCVESCPAPVYFDKNNYHVEENLGKFCAKLIRKGSLATPVPVAVEFSEQLSADASGPAPACCGCKAPVLCAGSKKCTVMFGVNEKEKCISVKFDQDPADKDREYSMSTTEEKVAIKIKNSYSGNCIETTKYINRIWANTQPIQVKLSKPAENDICTWFNTIDGSADGCVDYQGGKYKACFKKGQTLTNVYVAMRFPRRAGYLCYSQTLTPCEGETPIPPCSHKYSTTFGLSIPVYGAVYKCFNRSPTAATVCHAAHTEVVLLTILEDTQPSDCYVSYNVEIYQVFKGALKKGQKKTLQVLFAYKCPEPKFPYGRNYLVAGTMVDGKLTVEKTGFILNCPTFTPLLPSLCP